jgi:hypothetical protein
MRNTANRRFAPFSDYELECFLAGAAEPQLARRIEAAAARDEALAAHLRERRADRDAYAAVQRPFVPSEPRQARSPWRWLAPLGLVAAAASALVMFVPAGDSGVRAKGGGLTAQLYIERGGRTFAADPGTRFAPGDRVQVVVQAPAAGFVSLLAAERDGEQIYLDNLPVTAAATPASASFVLDNAPGPEHWRLVWSRKRQARPASDHGDAELELILDKRTER